jgi:hypothetical protein
MAEWVNVTSETREDVITALWAPHFGISNAVYDTVDVLVYLAVNSQVCQVIDNALLAELTPGN